MGRQTFVKNYNNLSGGVITDLNKLAGAPENAVKNALNFEFTASDGANRRKALDLESGISGSDYVQLNSSLSLGSVKQQVFTFKGILDSFDVPTHDIVFNSFEDTGITYDLGSDQQLADAVSDSGVANPLDASVGFQNVAWSPELRLFCSIEGSEIKISADGVNWTDNNTFSSDDTGSTKNTVVWCDSIGKFVVNGSQHSWVSSNGTDWDVYPYSGNLLHNSVWSPDLGLIVAIGGFTGSSLQTSPDGITWTSRTIDVGKLWFNVTWSPSLGLFAACAYSGGTATQKIMTSPDGVTWTKQTTPATDRRWADIVWAEGIGKFVAVGNHSYILTSTDGTTWVEAANASEANTWQGLEWSEELTLLVAISEDGTNRVMTSPNATTWTARSAADAATWRALTWSSDLGIFVAGATTGTDRLMTSPDGVTWTSGADGAVVNDNPTDWTQLQGVPIGAVGLPELAVLHNTSSVAYNLTTTLGLGSGALIRDFQGLPDGLAIDENPAVMVFNVGTIVGTFSLEDIEITDGTTTRRFSIIELPTAATLNVDKSIAIVSTTEFDGADTEAYATWTVLGLTSGATAVINTQSGSGLSDAHRYNLINQGWTQTHMDAYAVSTDTWPSNTQTWYSGRDSNNDFSPTELDKIAFGNSQASKGHILLNPFQEWRHSQVGGVWEGSVNKLTYSRGFTTLAEFGSRLALSGASISGVENNVYISPVLLSKVVTSSDSATISDLDFSDVFTFYQRNDPTADIGNALLPDDGLVVPIAAANRIYKVIELQNAIIVFADNGVWAISGLDAQSGFQTDSFSVVKVTGAPGTTAPRSIVSTSEAVYYWAADGIYAIQYSPEGAFSAANITINRIGGLYKGISPAVREAAISYYDEYNQKLYWAYNGETTATYPEIRNKMVVLNLSINAYYPLKMPLTLVDAGAQLGTLHMSINGFTQDPAYPNSGGTVPLKIFVTEIDSATSTNMKHSVMEFNNSGTDFSDYDLWRTDVHTDASGTVDEEAFLETWDDTLGDTSRSKQAIWVFTHMTKTEYGFEDLGGGALGALGQSSFLMQNRWDWNATSSGGKWGTAREIYRHSRPYVPVDDTDTFDTGESVITTKNKIYGRGRSLSLRFDAAANKDAILLGYSIPYSVENIP